MWNLLFDIDGTLIHTGGAGGAALTDAFREEFLIEQAAQVPFTGRTDRGIAGALFAAHKIPNTDQNWRRLKQGYLQRLPHHLPRRNGRVLPGVVELLSRLAERKDVALGLLTGNLREGAKTKLEYFGLFDRFAFGGFGDHHHDRNDVANEALQAARAHANDRFHSTRLWVIGDTPLDIHAARAIGARSFAVGTGGEAMDKLAALQPDVLVDNLADVDRVLEVLF